MMRVRVPWSGWAGGPGLSTFYFTVSTEDAAAAERVRGYVQNFVLNVMGPLLCNDVHGQIDTAVDVLTPSSGELTATHVSTQLLAVDGSGGTGQEAPATAGLIHLSTDVFIKGRRVRGRIFVSPLASGSVQDDGTLSDAQLTAANTAAIAVLASFSAGDNMVVWHRPKAKVGGAWGFIKSATYSQKLAVLTSRRD